MKNSEDLEVDRRMLSPSAKRSRAEMEAEDQVVAKAAPSAEDGTYVLRKMRIH
jgi:hypothetical protein